MTGRRARIPQEYDRPDFGPLAGRYDDLRTGEPSLETVERLVREGDLVGRRVLDVGCGTGRFAAALAEQYRCKVWGVDVSQEMLAVARERVPPGVGLKHGAAEDLPFRDAWFERVMMTLVVHLVDRSRAFPEIRRVLADGGRYAFLTFDPSYLAGYYLNTYFPSFLEIDLARFPSARSLEQELHEAGYAAVRTVRHRRQRTIDRETSLKKIRGRHISTFQLISEEEYREGLARAERELPERITYNYEWLIVVAER